MSRLARLPLLSDGRFRTSDFDRAALMVAEGSPLRRRNQASVSPTTGISGVGGCHTIPL
jgi:hypothetical protein